MKGYCEKNSNVICLFDVGAPIVSTLKILVLRHWWNTGDDSVGPPNYYSRADAKNRPGSAKMISSETVCFAIRSSMMVAS